MPVTISYLADKPEFVPVLAAGTQEQWSDLWPARDLEWRIKRLTDHMQRQELPIAWVVHDDDTVLGTAALRATDFEGREHLTPWLGGVFVFPEHRGQGLGGILCATVEAAARERGTKRLYLGTFENQQWYASMGWSLLEHGTLQGRPCDVMCKELS